MQSNCVIAQTETETYICDFEGNILTRLGAYDQIVEHMGILTCAKGGKTEYYHISGQKIEDTLIYQGEDRLTGEGPLYPVKVADKFAYVNAQTILKTEPI